MSSRRLVAAPMPLSLALISLGILTSSLEDFYRLTGLLLPVNGKVQLLDASWSGLFFGLLRVRAPMAKMTITIRAFPTNSKDC